MYSKEIRRDFPMIDESYIELLDETLGIIIDDKKLIVTRKTKEGKVEEKTFFLKDYINSVKITTGCMRFSVNSIYLKDTVNCFIKNGVLYLDKNIPFSRQMEELELSLSNIFFIRYGTIHYEGKISFFDKIKYGKMLESSKENEDDKNKTTIALANIKLKYIRLNMEFKRVVDEKINMIYSTSEERLASVDLTKPIEMVGKHSVYDQLISLDEQISVFIKYNDFLEEWPTKESSTIKKKIDELTEPYKTSITFKLYKERQEFFNLVVNNAIAESEGKEFIPREELADDFLTRIEKYCQLAREYYAKNRPTSEIITSPIFDHDLVIARIESIFSFYKIENPYKAEIAEIKRKLKIAISDQEDSISLEPYYKQLQDIFKKSETFALRETIENWKNHHAKIIYGSHPTLLQIDSVVEQYNKKLDKLVEYEITHHSNNSPIDQEEEIRDRYEKEYQSIIGKIEEVITNDNNNTMIKTSPDKVYEQALSNLTTLTNQISSVLRHQQLEDSINNLSIGRVKNTVEDDPIFIALFDEVVGAMRELAKLKKYAKNENLFNHASVQREYYNAKKEYDNMIQRILSLYQGNTNQEEYDKILEDLDSLANKIRIICTNEAKLLGEIGVIKEQKKML